MKVLQIYKDVFPEVSGGIERYVHDLAVHLQKSGMEVRVIVAGGGTRDVNGISVFGVASPVRILSNPIAPGYRSALGRADSDVLHFHLPLPSSVMAFLSLPEHRRKPYVVTYHSDIVRQSFLMPFYGPFLRMFLSKAYAVLATSKQYVSSSPYLSSLKNVKVIPIGVDLNRFTPDADPADDYFLFVGRFRAYKGIDVLLDAWNLLETPPRLIMAGGGAMENSIRRRISSAGLPVEVRTDVSDGELVKLYRNAKALILPSTKRSEAYGMVQLESMACGTPVISSNLNTGVSWVNRNGESGFTFTPGDSSDLAGKIRLMISPEFPVKALRDGARIRAEKNFDAGVLFGEVEECLIEAAENSQS